MGLHLNATRVGLPCSLVHLFDVGVASHIHSSGKPALDVPALAACGCCCRANVRILVRDTVAAKNGYGPYVEPVSVDITSQGGCVLATRHNTAHHTTSFLTCLTRCLTTARMLRPQKPA